MLAGKLGDGQKSSHALELGDQPAAVSVENRNWENLAFLLHFGEFLPDAVEPGLAHRKLDQAIFVFEREDLNRQNITHFYALNVVERKVNLAPINHAQPQRAEVKKNPVAAFFNNAPLDYIADFGQNEKSFPFLKKFFHARAGLARLADPCRRSQAERDFSIILGLVRHLDSRKDNISNSAFSDKQIVLLYYQR